MSSAGCQLLDAGFFLPEPSFRNATKALAYHIDMSGLRIQEASKALLALEAFAGAGFYLMLWAHKLHDFCVGHTTHWESFRYVCQGVHSSIGDMVFKFRQQLPLQSQNLHLQEALQNVARMTVQLLQQLAWAACPERPGDSDALAECAGYLGCKRLSGLLAGTSRDLAMGSHVIQTQLETALIWGADHLGVYRGGTHLPELPQGVRLGDLITADDFRSKTLGVLLDDLRRPRPHKLRAVEIGVHHGHVAVELLTRHPSLRYLGIDPYKGYYETRQVRTNSGDFGDIANYRHTLQRLRRFGRRARLCRRSSLRVARLGAVKACQVDWPVKNLDLVFIDGVHDFRSVSTDLHHWASRVRVGGIVAGHDYRLGDLDVVRAVHRHVPMDRQLHLGPDGVWWWIV
mmetsp:Transcript_47461/g.88813  ORF Transcript_47461/g.88813 Transcript_47461/m.88813 type:complete len:400 (-) Transcript_47461:20-1219(-)